MSQTEAEHAYFLMLVAEGRECDHPAQYRHAIPNYNSADPSEWECGVCGTWQTRGPDTRTGEGA